MLPDSRTWAPAVTRLTTLTLNAGVVVIGTPNTIAFQLPALTSILSITTSYPAWVTLYTSQTALTSDASRVITADPTAGSGAVVDAYCTTGVPTVVTSPVPTFNNPTSAPMANAYLSVRNMGGSNGPITVTIIHCPEQF